MLKIRLDKTKLSVSDNLVQIKTTIGDGINVTKECNSDPNDCKFGDIFLSLDGRIYYTCKFCESNYYCFKAFSNHFLEEHAIDWTSLIYPDGNFACCSKVEPDYSSYRDQYEIIEDVLGEDKQENEQEVVEEEVEDNQHFQPEQVVSVKQTDCADNSFYILHDFEPEEIIFKENFEDSQYVKLEKSNLEYKTEQDLQSTKNYHPYLQMIVKEEAPIIEEEVYTQNEFSNSSEQIIEVDGTDNNDEFIDGASKLIETNCYQPPKQFLQTIMQIRTNRCKFCNKTFCNLSEHYKQYSEKFICHIPQCSEPFDNVQDLNDHVEELHSDPDFIFKCYFCQFRDNDKQNLELHYRKEHLLETNFKCLKCDAEFCSQEELLAHDDAHIAFGEIHPEQKIESDFSTNMDVDQSLDCEDGNQTPNNKSKNFDSDSDTSSGVEETDKRRRDNHHIEIDDPMHPHFISLMKQFHTRRCKICKVKSSLLSTHYRKIHFEKFTCDINQCSEPFDTEEELAAHTAELHVDPDNPFKCAYCEYKTTEKRRLSYHYRRNHLVEKKYQCNYCPMKFFYEKERVQHHRVHTGEHPFSCEICGQAFKTAVIMRMHKKRKHEPPSESCEVCGKLFATKENLKNHAKRHLGTMHSTCHVCGISFSRYQCLRNHLTVHSVEVFECNLCQRTFNREKKLTEHSKLHEKYGLNNLPIRKTKVKMKDTKLIDKEE